MCNVIYAAFTVCFHNCYSVTGRKMYRPLIFGQWFDSDIMTILKMYSLIFIMSNEEMV